MGLFQRLFAKNWEPLICKPDDIIDLFKEALEIDVLSVRGVRGSVIEYDEHDVLISGLVIEYNVQKHEIGVSADYRSPRGFFDIDFYLDEQHFLTLDELCENARIDDIRFVDIDIIKVLEDKEIGNPRGNVLLKEREIV